MNYMNYGTGIFASILFITGTCKCGQETKNRILYRERPGPNRRTKAMPATDLPIHAIGTNGVGCSNGKVVGRAAINTIGIVFLSRRVGFQKFIERGAEIHRCGHDVVIVIPCILDGTETDLLQARNAKNRLRPRLGLRQRRQQHRRQDRDDGDHHKQLDQREALG